MTALFIGGPADGQRREVDERYQSLTIYVPPKVGQDFRTGAARYVEFWKGVYVLEGMPHDQPMQRLIDGYHPGVAIKGERKMGVFEPDQNERESIITHVKSTPPPHHVTIILPP